DSQIVQEHLTAWIERVGLDGRDPQPHRPAADRNDQDRTDKRHTLAQRPTREPHAQGRADDIDHGSWWLGLLGKRRKSAREDAGPHTSGARSAPENEPAAARHHAAGLAFLACVRQRFQRGSSIPITCTASALRSPPLAWTPLTCTPLPVIRADAGPATRTATANVKAARGFANVFMTGILSACAGG